MDSKIDSQVPQPVQPVEVRRPYHLGLNSARDNLVPEIQKSIFAAVFLITGVWKLHRHLTKILNEISVFCKKNMACCAPLLIIYDIRCLRTPGVLFFRK